MLPLPTPERAATSSIETRAKPLLPNKSSAWRKMVWRGSGMVGRPRGCLRGAGLIFDREVIFYGSASVLARNGRTSPKLYFDKLSVQWAAGAISRLPRHL